MQAEVRLLRTELTWVKHPKITPSCSEGRNTICSAFGNVILVVLGSIDCRGTRQEAGAH